MIIIPNKHYLFVCYANIARSPAAESWFRERADRLKIPIEVSSAGFEAETSKGRRRLEQFVLDKADIIFVMEEWMKKEIEEGYKLREQPIRNLGIPNVYMPSALDSISCKDLSFEKAVEYMDLVSKMASDYYIGRILFEKILEGRLERILV